MQQVHKENRLAQDIILTVNQINSLINLVDNTQQICVTDSSDNQTLQQLPNIHTIVENQSLHINNSNKQVVNIRSNKDLGFQNLEVHYQRKTSIFKKDAKIFIQNVRQEKQLCRDVFLLKNELNEKKRQERVKLMRIKDIEKQVKAEKIRQTKTEQKLKQLDSKSRSRLLQMTRWKYRKQLQEQDYLTRLPKINNKRVHTQAESRDQFQSINTHQMTNSVLKQRNSYQAKRTKDKNIVIVRINSINSGKFGRSVYSQPRRKLQIPKNIKANTEQINQNPNKHENQLHLQKDQTERGVQTNNLEIEHLPKSKSKYGQVHGLRYQECYALTKLRARFSSIESYSNN